MTAYTVGVIVGSVSVPSLNRRFAEALGKLAPEAELTFTDIAIGELPFYGSQYDKDFPPVGTAFKEALGGVDALLFVTPEYNRSIPGVLKNAIDWATRPFGTSAIADRPVAVIGASGSAVSTAVAQNHLKAILSSQGAALLGRPEAYIRTGPDFFTEDGAVANEGTREFLLTFLRAFHTHIARYES
ncbi:NADPH-dependent FMN reductase [Microbacterium sp. bgisy203]|uniref:NADPH-dependent FMN reductase n=1 Tax=Microbacterium sp. bgisy203 TaxID=3413799 RepID=UPI003D74FE1C